MTLKKTRVTVKTFWFMITTITFKGIQAVRIDFFFIFKVANIRCFILIAVDIFHSILRK